MIPDRLRLPAVPSLLLGTAGGLVLALAFPDHAWWPCAFLGVGMVLVSLIGRSGPGALAVGFATGLAFYLSLIDWASLFLGPIPYAALSVLESMFWALGSLLITWAYRRLGTGTRAGLVLTPVAVAGLWTLREAVASTWPYGGFAWGRVGQSQAGGPFAELVSWLGLSGLTFVVVLLVAAVLESVRHRSAGLTPIERRPAGPLAVRALAAAAGVAVLAAIPVYPVVQTGTIRVAAVQGNTPEAGYFFPGERGDVLDAHLEATRGIPADAGVDVVLWPEGSVDVSPVYNRWVAVELTRLAESLGVPIVANTVTVDEGATEADDTYFNTQFVWSPEGGMTSEVDKHHPIPFGEYIPDRDFWYPLAPDLIGLIERGYTPGTGPAVLALDGVLAGTFICFDIVDDAVVRDAVVGGAEFLYAPTNNADFVAATDDPSVFLGTSELAQQLSFARLRAMETGRAVVQVSTVGDSAVYAADGTLITSIGRFEAGVMITDVPTASGLTPAVAFGRATEFLVAGAGLVLLVGSRLGAGRTPRPRSGDGAFGGVR